MGIWALSADMDDMTDEQRTHTETQAMAAELTRLQGKINEQQQFMAYQQQLLDTKLGENYYEDEEEVDVYDFLPSKEIEAITELGKTLIAMCQKAPPLEGLAEMMRSIPLYRGIPQTAAAGNGGGGDLTQISRKLEATLNLLVSQADQPANPGLLRMTVALIRSALEDALQARKRMEAGGRRHLLDPRPDRAVRDLLSEEERKRVGSSAATSRGQSRLRSRSRGRGRAQSAHPPAAATWRTPSPAWRAPSPAFRGRNRGSGRGYGRGRGATRGPRK